MKLMILKGTKEVGAKAAELVINEIKKKPDLVLGLAAGGTMIPFYQSLIRLWKNKKVDFSHVSTFNIDEYVGLSGSDKRSFRYFMQKHFFSRIGVWQRNVHFLDGRAINLNVECKNYEKNIKEVGGIDLQILGIGRNGHIGFNEPGSSFKSRTREVLLSEITLRDNARFFGNDLKKVPRRALTMGIGAILEARKIILLASDKKKAEIVHRALHGEVSKDVPASVLQKHKDVTFIFDKEAASELD